MISVSGFYIIDPIEDQSVGIYSYEWEISGEFEFYDEDEYNEFKRSLKHAWEEYQSDNVIVESFEEREERIKNEQDF